MVRPDFGVLRRDALGGLTLAAIQKLKRTFDTAWTTPTPDALAADWIACGGDFSGDATNGLAQFLSGTFPHSEPQLTWDTIMLVVKAFSEADFYSETKTKTEAQKVCGQLAAGPVEELLSYHGPDYIERFESEARLDRRMAWVLGGVWQAEMSDDIWDRVRHVSDDSYWNRKIT